jgi:LysM repeat protein
MSSRWQRSLRLLAPASLALFAATLLVVVVTSLGDSSSGSNESSRSQPRAGQTQTSSTTRSTGDLEGRRFYVVKPGDTLLGIANATGVDVDELLALNPAIDPQALVTGQRLKLR